jgi:hypothetical protein
MTDIRTETEAAKSACVDRDKGSCIGAACMAWRWQPLMADAAYLLALEKVHAEFDKAAPKRERRFASAYLNQNRAKYGLKVTPDTGYCGLAGLPQTATSLK